MRNELIDPVYLPFTSEQLEAHFAPVTEEDEKERHLRYYIESAGRYRDFKAAHPHRCGMSLSELRRPCQTEKDERFWTVTCLMKYFHSSDPVRGFAALLLRAFGSAPPCRAFGSWEKCLQGKLHLFFEVSLPSPQGYKKWLREHLRERHFVPYVLDAACQSHGREIKKHLEGPTHLDAMLLSEENGFAVFFEAKVLSDISHQVSFDIARNQIARNVDVMMERNSGLEPLLDRRVPERTLFVLLTPEFFRENPHTRHYGQLLREYREDPSALARDLQHRRDVDWTEIARRIGWLTWEDCQEILPGSCPWLQGKST